MPSDIIWANIEVQTLLGSFTNCGGGSHCGFAYKHFLSVELWFLITHSCEWFLCQPCELCEHSKLNYYDKFSLEVILLLPPFSIHFTQKLRRKEYWAWVTGEFSSFSRQKWKAKASDPTDISYRKLPKWSRHQYETLASNQPVWRYSALPKLNSTALGERQQEALSYLVHQDQCSWS